MVVDQVREYLEHGTDPQRGQLPQRRDAARVALPRRDRQCQRAQHAGPDLDDHGARGLNIHNMVNKSRGEMAYTLVDVDSPVDDSLVAALAAIHGVLSVRAIPADSCTAESSFRGFLRRLRTLPGCLPRAGAFRQRHELARALRILAPVSLNAAPPVAFQLRGRRLDVISVDPCARAQERCRSGRIGSPHAARGDLVVAVSGADGPARPLDATSIAIGMSDAGS